jgi:hypothetical protein
MPAAAHQGWRLDNSASRDQIEGFIDRGERTARRVQTVADTSSTAAPDGCTIGVWPMT